MRDKFPKARCHALVVARDPGLRSIADLRAPQHLGLLDHMRRVGEDWARARRAQVGWRVASPGTAELRGPVGARWRGLHGGSRAAWRGTLRRGWPLAPLRAGSLPYSTAPDAVLQSGPGTLW